LFSELIVKDPQSNVSHVGNLPAHDGKSVALFVLSLSLALFGIIAMCVEFARGTQAYGLPLIIWILAFLVKLIESFRLRSLLKAAYASAGRR
jgi:hypothetical protein